MSVQYIEGIGRRKEATARVRLMSGSGKFIVNQKLVEEYFPRLGDREAILKPFEVTGQDGATFDVTVLVNGGPSSGQVEPGIHSRSAQVRSAHSRSTHQGTQEARSQARPQGTDLHQTLNLPAIGILRFW